MPGSLLACLIIFNTISAQQPAPVQDPTLSIHFFLIDFNTAASIRSTSLSSALISRNFGKTKGMSPGLAISYIRGITSHFDYSVRLGGSFLDYPQQNRSLFKSDAFLLESDISLRGKMVSNRYWVVPFVQAGLGASKYKGYFGAFIPAGVGLQINIFNEAYFLIHSQYRIPITETTNYHFYHSIGLSGSISGNSE